MLCGRTTAASLPSAQVKYSTFFFVFPVFVPNDRNENSFPVFVPDEGVGVNTDVLVGNETGKQIPFGEDGKNSSKGDLCKLVRGFNLRMVKVNFSCSQLWENLLVNHSRLEEGVRAS